MRLLQENPAIKFFSIISTKSRQAQIYCSTHLPDQVSKLLTCHAFTAPLDSFRFRTHAGARPGDAGAGRRCGGGFQRGGDGGPCGCGAASCACGCVCGGPAGGCLRRGRRRRRRGRRRRCLEPAAPDAAHRELLLRRAVPQRPLPLQPRRGQQLCRCKYAVETGQRRERRVRRGRMGREGGRGRGHAVALVPLRRPLSPASLQVCSLPVW